MSQLSKEQRVVIVTAYIRTQSIHLTQQEFHEHFPDREIPARTTIYYNVRKYNDRGSILNQNENRSGRRRTGRTGANVEAVRERLEEAPPRDISARRNGLGISKSTFNEVGFMMAPLPIENQTFTSRK